MTHLVPLETLDFRRPSRGFRLGPSGLETAHGELRLVLAFPERELQHLGPLLGERAQLGMTLKTKQPKRDDRGERPWLESEQQWARTSAGG